MGDDTQLQVHAMAAASLAYWLGKIREAVALEYQRKALEVLGRDARVGRRP
jgi:hypothetical protein